MNGFYETEMNSCGDNSHTQCTPTSSDMLWLTTLGIS